MRVGVMYLYGNIQHEPRLSAVRHTHDPDAVSVAHTHLLRNTAQLALTWLMSVSREHSLLQTSLTLQKSDGKCSGVMDTYESSDNTSMARGPIKFRAEEDTGVISSTQATTFCRFNDTYNVWRGLTGVLPADVLQVELRIIGHVFLNPRPALNLLIGGRNNEETETRE